MDQKQIILDFLEQSYTGAKMMDDNEMMCRLSRAIIAFSYNDFEKNPSWDKMIEQYISI